MLVPTIRMKGSSRSLWRSEMAVEQYHGIGRRKTSVARVYLRPGSGGWEINGRPLEDYFPRLSLQKRSEERRAGKECRSAGSSYPQRSEQATAQAPAK